MGNSDAELTVQPMIYQRLKSWPICWVCKKPVNRLSSFADPVLRHIFFTASCHGEIQNTKLTYEFLCDTPPETLKFGWAFKPDNLLGVDVGDSSGE